MNRSPLWQRLHLNIPGRYFGSHRLYINRLVKLMLNTFHMMNKLGNLFTQLIKFDQMLICYTVKFHEIRFVDIQWRSSRFKAFKSSKFIYKFGKPFLVRWLGLQEFHETSKKAFVMVSFWNRRDILGKLATARYKRACFYTYIIQSYEACTFDSLRNKFWKLLLLYRYSFL